MPTRKSPTSFVVPFGLLPHRPSRFPRLHLSLSRRLALFRGCPSFLFHPRLPSRPRFLCSCLFHHAYLYHFRGCTFHLPRNLLRPLPLSVKAPVLASLVSILIREPIFALISLSQSNTPRPSRAKCTILTPAGPKPSTPFSAAPTLLSGQNH